MCIAFTIVTSHQDVEITFYRVACRMDPRLRGDDSLRERISKTRHYSATTAGCGLSFHSSFTRPCLSTPATNTSIS